MEVELLRFDADLMAMEDWSSESQEETVGAWSDDIFHSVIYRRFHLKSRLFSGFMTIDKKADSHDMYWQHARYQ
jgi:hypothetical protein